MPGNRPARENVLLELCPWLMKPFHPRRVHCWNPLLGCWNRVAARKYNAGSLALAAGTDSPPQIHCWSPHFGTAGTSLRHRLGPLSPLPGKHSHSPGSIFHSPGQHFGDFLPHSTSQTPAKTSIVGTCGKSSKMDLRPGLLLPFS